MKVSIVIPSYNRRLLLMNTLATIANSVYKDDIEIIIIDDASDEDNRLEDLVEYKGLNIKLTRIEPEEKKWYNSVIPFNMGFQQASSDVIIMQNAECIHIGDLVSYVINNIKESNYIVFSCYSVGEATYGKINIMNLNAPFYEQIIKDAIRDFRRDRPEKDFSDGWYNHSYWNPSALHFCSAIMKKDLEFLGGFDENYAYGIGHDDFDFLESVMMSGGRVKLQIIDDPFVIHQPHAPFECERKGDLFMRNQFYHHNSYFQSGEPVIKNEYFPLEKKIEKKISNNTAYATHQPLVKAVIDLYKPKFVLELGIGKHSTSIFLDYDIELLGVENDKEWIDYTEGQYGKLNVIHHDVGDVKIGTNLKELNSEKIVQINEFYRTLDIPEQEYNLLFVDQYASCRTLSINLFKSKFDLIIYHDCEPTATLCFSYDKIDNNGFKSYYLKSSGPWTCFMVREEKDKGFQALRNAIKQHLEDFNAIYEPTYSKLTTQFELDG